MSVAVNSLNAYFSVIQFDISGRHMLLIIAIDRQLYHYKDICTMIYDF